MCYTKEIFYQLDDPLQFKLSTVKEIKDFFIAKTNGQQKILLGASSGVSLHLFTTIICATVEITNANISLVFLISNGVVKKFLKRERKKKQT